MRQESVEKVLGLVARPSPSMRVKARPMSVRTRIDIHSANTSTAIQKKPDRQHSRGFGARVECRRGHLNGR